MTGIYVVISTLLLIFSIMAVVKARAVGLLVPFWFVLGWLTSELAIWVLLFIAALNVVAWFLIEVSGQAATWAGFFCLGSALLLLESLRRSFDSGQAFDRAFKIGLGDEFIAQIPASRRSLLNRHIHSSEWLWPFRFVRPSVRVERDIAYGDAGKRNWLDIYVPSQAAPADRPRPVLLQIHGGAWIIGHKAEQGQPLLYRMAELGWVGVSINYRLSPRNAFPAHIEDVKRAIAWVKANITEYGGDPEFIAVTGGSAGGHLTLLSALTPNYAAWQPGFEQVDTRIQAAMPLYPPTDLLNRHHIRQQSGIDEPVISRVFPGTEDESMPLRDEASPLTWVVEREAAEDAPPMLVIQGDYDSLVWVEETRLFVSELTQRTTASVVYAELAGAQHAFEFFHSPRTSHYLVAATAWLEWVYAQWSAQQPTPQPAANRAAPSSSDLPSEDPLQSGPQ
jgi:acetyl esterase/lipase